MHPADTDIPRALPAVLRNLAIVRTALRSGLRTIVLACVSLTVFLAMGEFLVR